MSPVSETPTDLSLDSAEVLDLAAADGDSPLEDGAAPVADPVAAAAEAGEKRQVARWYAVQVASSCEKKVKATLEQRAVTLGVDSKILDI